MIIVIEDANYQLMIRLRYNAKVNDEWTFHIRHSLSTPEPAHDVFIRTARPAQQTHIHIHIHSSLSTTKTRPNTGYWHVTCKFLKIRYWVGTGEDSWVRRSHTHKKFRKINKRTPGTTGGVPFIQKAHVVWRSVCYPSGKPLTHALDD